MLAVRFFSRIPTLVTPFKRTSCIRLLAGLTSGASALTVVCRHYRVHAASAPKPQPYKTQPIVQDIERKRSSPSEKFDWNLFWYYLRPQVWIIACATAVRFLRSVFAFHDIVFFCRLHLLLPI